MYEWIIEADLHRFRKQLYLAETLAERAAVTALIEQAQARLGTLRAARADEGLRVPLGTSPAR